MAELKPFDEQTAATAAHFSLPEAQGDVRAWEEVEQGRFMPRRVRGSCVGRALGWTFTVSSSLDESERRAAPVSPADPHSIATGAERSA